MQLRRVETERAPAAIGPYSQAIAVGGFVFTAGQLGLDPATGRLVGDDARSQAAQALRNIAAVLEAAGASLDAVVKTTIFLVDLNDFAAVNEVYAEHFGAHRPARSTVQVAALPAGGRVEIEAVAVVG